MKAFRAKNYVSLFVWATAVALVIRFFLVEDYRIFSDSMAPGLLSGDLIFVSKSNYNVRLPFSSYEIFKIRRPRRGEVVAFALPDTGLDTYVKRVVAIEGDEVAIRNGLLTVNGKPLDVRNGSETSAHLRWESAEKGEPYPIVWEEGQIRDYGPVTIPVGHFFVLGDNRVKSVDSRSWGPIPYSCLKGKVSLIWLSLGTNGSWRTERMGKWVRS